MVIQIFGLGCPTCRRMASDVRELVEHLKLDAVVEQVDDVEKIATLHLFVLPGLVIDGKVMMCGYSGKAKIERLLVSL